MVSVETSDWACHVPYPTICSARLIPMSSHCCHFHYVLQKKKKMNLVLYTLHHKHSEIKQQLLEREKKM